MRYLFLALLLFSYGWAEVSVFGAGDLKSSNPYGLSESEKVIYANKKATLQNQKEIRSLKLKIEQLNESLEGLRSVVDSLSEKIGQTGQKLYELDSQKKSADQDEVAVLKQELAEQKAQNEKIVTALKKLTVMIDKINADYVSRQELNSVKKKVTKRSSVKAEPKAKKQKSNKTLLNEAIKAYRSKKYDAAIDIFETLDQKNYKRATSNYYLGEIAYYQKRYSDAIVYFKKSASLYDKASYMPTLLLHTALSFKKLGETENARLFFEAITETYPDTPQAKIAHKNL
jgi:TolA-binding protein